MTAEGVLSPDELEKIKQWMTDHGGVAMKGCPQCNATRWILGDKLAALPIYAPGTTILGPSYPTIVLVCEKCGFMQFVSAIVAGIVSREGKEASNG